ncbi:MAG TPA: HigA family addiction module antitoxin [Pseudobacter sp.]|nr:HigA family addiction module antitoxin [Pseudobacter sp.]
MLKRGMKLNHPGQIVKSMCFDPLGLTLTEAAKNLGVTRKTLSLLINGRQGISAEMALRLAKAFKTTPGLWMNLQMNYDLQEASKKVKLEKIVVYKKLKMTPETHPAPKITKKSALKKSA